MVNGNPHLPAGERTAERWFDTNVFLAECMIMPGGI
jgi:hypothetical protein